MSRYRRLRGFANHVLPILRNEGLPKGGRILVAWWLLDRTMPKIRGQCRWCRLGIKDDFPSYIDLEVSRRVGSWHADCQRQRDSVVGWSVSPFIFHEGYCRLCQRDHQFCPGCGRFHGARFHSAIQFFEVLRGEPHCKGLMFEVEHDYPIHRGWEDGVKDSVRAFLLENLRWLCEDCHKAKTAAERRAASQRKVERAQLRLL